MATWLLEVYFCALPITYRTSDTLKVIEVFPYGLKVVAEACRNAGGKRTAVDKLIEIMATRD